MTHITAQAIQSRYWEIANDTQQRGYVRVRALDSLSKMLGLFDLGKHMGKHLFETAIDKVEGGVSDLIRECRQIIADGVDLTDFSMYDRAATADEQQEEKDDEEGKTDDEEPP